jgi:hypothetical protein
MSVNSREIYENLQTELKLMRRDTKARSAFLVLNTFPDIPTTNYLQSAIMRILYIGPFEERFAKCLSKIWKVEYVAEP